MEPVVSTPVSIASAGGKVLITGGYLILEPAYSGLVIAVTARFYSGVSLLNDKLVQQLGMPASLLSKSSTVSSSGPANFSVVVLAPQRSIQPSVYTASLSADGRSLNLKRESGFEDNPFVEHSLRQVIVTAAAMMPRKVLLSRLLPGLFVLLQGDNEFYGSTDPNENDAPSSSTTTSESATAPKSEYSTTSSKTGLGSSAALVASLVGALFAHVGLPLDAKHSTDTHVEACRLLGHNVAQTAHCAAQGKVGSGFDVSAAFFGSQVYRRFVPECVERLLQAGPVVGVDLLQMLCCSRSHFNQLQSFSQQTGRKSTSPSTEAKQPAKKQKTRWFEFTAEPAALPPGLELVLGDVKGGSSTPGMVKKVLAWRKEQKAEADKQWKQLGKHNDTVASLLASLRESSHQSDRYDYTIARCATTPAAQWSKEPGTVEAVLSELHSEFQKVRRGLREMGESCAVPIEPPSQTKLLDDTMSQPGVVFAGVPGAGGVDAIFAVTLRQATSSVLKYWASRGVQQLRVNADTRQGLQLKQRHFPPVEKIDWSRLTLSKL